MPEQTPRSASASLPDAPNLEWLRKQAKRRLAELRTANAGARLADAQFDLARAYGFASWRALKAHVDSLGLDGQLFAAAKAGDVGALSALLDAHPERLNVRNEPYAWTLLHVAAHEGHSSIVEQLLARGLDVNAREKGDNTYAMHWAAAAGHLEVVRRLADAGGDVVGAGDDHELEVIGWASCSEGDVERQRAVADFLVSRGARHHIFSAIALDLADEVRRIVADDRGALTSRMSRFEELRTPLHFAVLRNRPAMVSLLLELGADPLEVDGSGLPAAVYATSPHVDERVMAAIRTMTKGELSSADRSRRGLRSHGLELISAVALADWDVAERLVREDAATINPTNATAVNALHVMAKRGDHRAVAWLLAHGANPNAMWAHWDAQVTPLHLAAAFGHAEVVRMLLAAGADMSIDDSKHHAPPIGWADYFQHPEIVQILEAHASP